MILSAAMVDDFGGIDGLAALNVNIGPGAFEDLVRAYRADAERDARENAPGFLAAAATWYAEQGWPIFPLHPKAKTPATRHGFQDATCDPGQVRTWWKHTPQANIGTPTGARPHGCGYDVIDVDGPDGYTSLRELYAVLPADRIVAKAATGRGGLHLWMTAAGLPSNVRRRPGIDTRGAGGYVVLPPSITERRYRWCPAPWGWTP